MYNGEKKEAKTEEEKKSVWVESIMSKDIIHNTFNSGFGFLAIVKRDMYV